MDNNKIFYRIFQVELEDETRDYRYASLDLLKKLNLKVDPINYDAVYEGRIETTGKEPYQILEMLFYKFNMDHPEDYRGRSMSVSDVVQLGNSDDYYYCDSIGFQKIEFK